MDVLATLLGYNGIDELILSKSGQAAQTESEPDPTVGRSDGTRSQSRPKKVTKKVPAPVKEEEPRKHKPTRPKQNEKKKPVREDTEEEEPEMTQTYTTKYKTPGMNKRFGQRSMSPKRQHVQHYHEDLSDLAVSKKIHFNPKINREKMEEAEFLKNLSSDEDAQGTFSREKMEKEISLFRMYLNLKKRYNKDPKRFLRIFKIYFGKDPPMEVNIDWNSNEHPEFMLTYEDFREYYTQLIKLHERCGDECIHLKRFYNKMGVHKRYQGKKYLVLNKQDFNRLPASKPRRKNSLERLVKRYYRFY